MNWSPLLVLVIGVAVELIVVGALGQYLATRFGFNYARLTPVAFLVYGATGYFAMRHGGSAALTGAGVASIDAGVWARSGGLAKADLGSMSERDATVMMLLLGSAVGAICGAIGAWAGNL